MKKKGINYCKYISRNGYMKVIEVGNVFLICLSIVKLRDIMMFEYIWNNNRHIFANQEIGKSTYGRIRIFIFA